MEDLKGVGGLFASQEMYQSAVNSTIADVLAADTYTISLMQTSLYYIYN